MKRSEREWQFYAQGWPEGLEGAESAPRNPLCPSSNKRANHTRAESYLLHAHPHFVQFHIPT